MAQCSTETQSIDIPTDHDELVVAIQKELSVLEDLAYQLPTENKPLKLELELEALKAEYAKECQLTNQLESQYKIELHQLDWQIQCYRKE